MTAPDVWADEDLEKAFRRGKLAAYDEVFATKATANSFGREGTCGSVPGNAWDVLATDRDYWKAEAARTQKKLNDLERWVAMRAAYLSHLIQAG
jgi:hypothetical protein